MCHSTTQAMGDSPPQCWSPPELSSPPQFEVPPAPVPGCRHHAPPPPWCFPGVLVTQTDGARMTHCWRLLCGGLHKQGPRPSGLQAWSEAARLLWLLLASQVWDRTSAKAFPASAICTKESCTASMPSAVTLSGWKLFVPQDLTSFWTTCC
jgi:hypothetical protein